MDYNRLKYTAIAVVFFLLIIVGLQYRLIKVYKNAYDNKANYTTALEDKYENSIKKFENIDSLLSTSLKARTETVYITNKIIYEKEKQVIANYPDTITDSLFRATLQWGYQRYGYLLKKE
jgi:hypothetical protein